MRIGLLRFVIPSTVFVLFACTDDDHDQFRSDVLDCEEAVAHLESCCGPGFAVAQDACRYSFDHTTGCDSWTNTTVSPGMDSVESACVRSRSCDDLVTNKVCARAQGLTARISSQSGDSQHPGTQYPATGGYLPVSVCP